MGLDFQPMKVVVPIGAAANTAAVEYPLLAAGSNYIQVQAVRLIDRVGMSGASGSAYMQATAYNKGAAGAGTTVVAQRSNNASAGDYIAAYVPWSLTMATTPGYDQLDPGEVLTLKIGGSGANGTFTGLVAEVDYALGYGGGI